VTHWSISLENPRHTAHLPALAQASKRAVRSAMMQPIGVFVFDKDTTEGRNRVTASVCFEHPRTNEKLRPQAPGITPHRASIAVATGNGFASCDADRPSTSSTLKNLDVRPGTRVSRPIGVTFIRHVDHFSAGSPTAMYQSLCRFLLYGRNVTPESA
jgi:hypothetical protein